MIKITESLALSISSFCQVLEHVTPARTVLTVPHDGMISGDLGFFQKRDKGADGTRAVHGRDTHVWPIVNDIVQNATKDGVGVDAVRFLVPRIYVDANRALTDEENLIPGKTRQTALDDPRLIPAYESYFDNIRRLVNRSVETHGKDKVLFVDCHGFGKQPDIAPPEGFDLILGTGNRSTIKHSNVDRDFAKAMREFGYKVFLPEKNPVSAKEDPYSAGHTTLYVAKNFDVDCMQIEIAPRFRTREGTDNGILLARRMSDFLARQYCPR